MKKSRRIFQQIRSITNWFAGFRFVIFAGTAFLLILSAGSFAQNSFQSAFIHLNAEPILVEYSNNLQVNNNGGHLQGIQLLHQKSGDYAIVTGSSDSYSYFATIKLGEKNEVVSLKQLMDKPFKHAGGCQVYKYFLAVGIEDNAEKDKSKVCIYDVSKPENTAGKPLVEIERKGEPMRSTAGCVGITGYKNKILLAVGDWDTKNIDFYSSKTNNVRDGEFELVSSINTSELSKEGWIDQHWWPYQNINLFHTNENELYLVGLGEKSNNENVADLYCLTEISRGEFSFKKVASKICQTTKGCRFKAAAGVEFSENGSIRIISAGYNIHEISHLNIFDSQK